MESNPKEDPEWIEKAFQGVPFHGSPCSFHLLDNIVYYPLLVHTHKTHITHITTQAHNNTTHTHTQQTKHTNTPSTIQKLNALLNPRIAMLVLCAYQAQRF